MRGWDGVAGVCVREDPHVVTEGRVRALWKGVQAAEHSVVGCGLRWVAR